MRTADSTSWNLIQGAARGVIEDREAFTERYGTLIRSYFAARWRQGPWKDQVDDAVQNLFLDCFRSDGILERFSPRGNGGFRAFLYGAARNVALRIESGGGRRRPGLDGDLDRIATEDDTPSREFDRDWARMVLADALDILVTEAQNRGPRALRRVDLLRMRTLGGLTSQQVAERWDCRADQVHREFYRAKEDFKRVVRIALEQHRIGEEPIGEADLHGLLNLLQAEPG